MKRGFFIILLLVTTTLWAIPTVKVGVNIGLTGAGAAVGTDQLQKAILLAQDKLNTRPNTPYTYKLVFEDNQSTPAGSAKAAQKLININKPDALITIYDFAVVSTLPIIKRAQIPSIGVAWGVEYAQPPYSFIFGYSEVASANVIYDGLKHEDVPTTIIAINQAALPRFVQQIESKAKEDGLKNIDVIYINPSEAEFRTTLLKAKEKGCKRLVLLAWGNPLNRIIYQLRQMPDFTPQLWGMGAGLASAQDKEYIQGAIVFSPAKPSSEFIEDYTKFTGKAPLDNDAYGYDALMILASSIEEAQLEEISNSTIASALSKKKSFNGVTGKYTQENGVFDTQPSLYKITADGHIPFNP